MIKSDGKETTMKRAMCFLLAVAMLALVFCSCGKTGTFSPELILADGYRLDGETIRAEFYNMDYVNIYSDIKVSRGNVRLYSNRDLDEYFDGDELDLEDGENVFCMLVWYGSESWIYDVVIKNTMIVGLSVEKRYERVYGVGDVFDRDSVKVTAELFSGGTAEINDYDAEFTFDSEGEKSVKISCGGYVCNFAVCVDGQYAPTISDDMKDVRGAVYEINEGKASLADGTAVIGYFVVPARVVYEGKEYPVCEIKDYAFYENSALTGVTLGKIKIGEAAFCGCTSLKVAIMDDGTELSGYAFMNCASLIKVSLPQKTTKIPDGFFSGCGSLAEISLHEGLKEIGHQAFESCNSLSEVILPQSAEYIGRRAFSSCMGLARVIGGIGLYEIDDGAFSGCPSLEILAVPQESGCEENVLRGSVNCTVYSGNTSIVMYNFKAEGGSGVIIKEGITVLDCESEFLLGDEISSSDAEILLYTDVYFGLTNDFEISCDLSAPGARKIKIICGEYVAQADAYAEYTVVLSGTMDEDGAEYSVDRASGTATLVKLPDNLSFGKFVVPTGVFDGEKTYPVTVIEEGAIAHPLLEKLFIHSDIKLIENGAIRDCPRLSLIYCGAKSNSGLKIGEGNFEGISDKAVILCDLKSSPMQQYALMQSLAYAGLETDALYFLPRRGAKSTYSADEKFDFSGCAMTYIASGFDVTTLTEDDVAVEYDFSENGTVRISYKGLTAEMKVTIE